MAPGWRLVVLGTEETFSAVRVLVTVSLPLLAGTLGAAAATVIMRRLAVGGGTLCSPAIAGRDVSFGRRVAQ